MRMRGANTIYDKMADKGGSGISKKRAWGRKRCKPQLVSIDDLDIEVLTKVGEVDKKLPYSATDLQNPESMTNNTLIYHLSRMKVDYHSSRHSREGLLHLFRIHIYPKPQRNKNWRRRGREKTVMEVSDNRTCMDWDNTRKRCIQ